MTFLPIDHFKSYMLDLFKGLLFFIRHVCVLLLSVWSPARAVIAQATSNGDPNKQ